MEGGPDPVAIEASARGAGNPGGLNADLPVDCWPHRIRPLCPFPGMARYNGEVNVKGAASWRCSGPLKGRRN